jgi:hypothetical protein
MYVTCKKALFAIFFLLTRIFTISTMEEKRISRFAQLQLAAQIPPEVQKIVNNFLHITEEMLTQEERNAFNLPFRHAVTHERESRLVPYSREASIQYVNPKTKKITDVFSQPTSWHPLDDATDRTVYKCIGPFTLRTGTYVIINNYLIALTGSVRLNNGQRLYENIIENAFAQIARFSRLNISLDKLKDAGESYVAVQSVDPETCTLYTAARNGAIYAYPYEADAHTFAIKKQIQPPPYKPSDVRGIMGSVHIQFDYQKPHVLLVLNQTYGNDLIIDRTNPEELHTSIIENGDATRWRTGSMPRCFSLLASDHKADQMKLLGENLIVRLITLDKFQFNDLILEYVVHAAKEFCTAPVQQQTLIKAQQIMAAFIKATPQNMPQDMLKKSDHYFWIWTSQYGEKNYYLKTIHELLKKNGL